MLKGYIAGSLFNEAETKQRLYEGQILRMKTGQDIQWFNPIESPINNKSKLPTAIEIFVNDTIKLLESDFVIADITNNDVGVAMELGIIYGVQYVLKTLNDYVNENSLNEDESIKNLITYLNQQGIKYKNVIAHCSDIRLQTAGEYENIYVPYGLNQYVIGGLESMNSYITNNFDNAVNILIQMLEQIKNPKKDEIEIVDNNEQESE